MFTRGNKLYDHITGVDGRRVQVATGCSVGEEAKARRVVKALQAEVASARRARKAFKESAWPTVRLPPDLQGRTITYVVGFVEGAVKIGVTKDLDARRRAFATALPVDLRLIHFLPGDHEQSLLSVAAPWHVAREWFHRDCLRRVAEWKPDAISGMGR